MGHGSKSTLEGHSTTKRSGGSASAGVQGTERIANASGADIPTLDDVVAGRPTGPLKGRRSQTPIQVDFSHNIARLKARRQLRSRLQPTHAKSRVTDDDIPTLTVVVPAKRPDFARAPVEPIAPPTPQVRAAKTATARTSKSQPQLRTLADLRNSLESKEMVADNYLHLCFMALAAALISTIMLWWYQSVRQAPTIDVIIQKPKIEFTAPATTVPRSAFLEPLPLQPSQEISFASRAPVTQTPPPAVEIEAPQVITADPDASALAPAPATVATPDVDAGLAHARDLLENGYIIWPYDENAVSVLTDLLDAAPKHERALAMLEEAAADLTAQAARAYDDGFTNSAAQVLDAVLEFYPTYSPAVRLQAEFTDIAGAE